MTDFFLMRHAPTEWNAAGRIQGQADAPLTPAGLARAVSWGTALKGLALDRLLTSDIGRAVATARHVNTAIGLPVRSDARLREQDWGRWTGWTHARIRQEAAEVYGRQRERGWHFRPPGGESHLEVLERVLAALREAAADQPGKRLLVVTHEGVLKGLLYHLAIRDGCGRHPHLLKPHHVHHVWGDETALTLARINVLNLDPDSDPGSRPRPAPGMG